ncbi:MAG: GNAT family N-acetyltransferase [Intrasporangium sp.]|uniref:GNAT family N-acetyltransferase n=1 Tax=Intrasporangium sp. TaxID=1925024 RepID=UPI00264942FD|nr:GNAT family N-acetyltransferase [Intrasporangium sp.]MDN5798305.1 GNAT family N-acetyltransferase [Intrasporangium sp.]
MTDALLEVYDDQLRTEAEVHDAEDVTHIGPLWCATFDDGSGGFVTYRDLAGTTGTALDALIRQAVAHFRDTTRVATFEWKTRGHDRPADLTGHLVAQGLQPQERETVMVGPAAGLAVEVPLPAGVAVRRAHADGDLAHDAARAIELQGRVFGGGSGPSAERLVADLDAPGDRLTLWLAEADGRVVCAGRLSIVPGTEFAGLWGGATDPAWRGRGIYRALTAARARYALQHGARYLHSDSTEMSRPILTRSGLRAVTTTTPYVWTRSPP